MPLKRRTFLLLILVFLLILITPVIIYIINFQSFGISSKTFDWAYFGDYLGGVFTPIISLASLIVLGSLTYIMSRQGSEEKRKLFLLEQKSAAYQDIVKYIKEIHFLPSKISEYGLNIGLIVGKLEGKNMEYFTKEAIKIRDIFNVFSEVYYTLKTFAIRYGHIFNYDFTKTRFNSLLKEAKKAHTTVEEYKNHFSDVSKVRTALGKGTIEILLNAKYMKLLTSFMQEIQSELE